MAGNTTSAKKFSCTLHGRTYSDKTVMRCYFASMTLFLYDCHFAYICFALLFIIVIISIFGKIKADYLWFILNQAIWDIAITYSYMQNEEIQRFADTGYITIIYDSRTRFIDEFLDDIINTNPFTSLLLLSWSRFLALYFSHFYDRITAKTRIFIIIIGFNFVVCFFHISAFVGYLLQVTRTRLNLYCRKEKLSTDCKGWYESQSLYIFLQLLYGIFRTIVLFKPIIFLCLSIFAAAMILIKIAKQAKFQLKHNRRDFFISFRISAVIFFQTIINCVLVFVEFTESIDDVLADIFNVLLEKHKPCTESTDALFVLKSCTDFIQLPEWLDDDVLDFGLESPVIYPAFKQLRIFLESIIIISLMAGYREAIMKFFKYFYGLFTKSKPPSPNESALFVNRSSVGAMASVT